MTTKSFIAYASGGLVGATTLNIMTFSIMKVSIMGVFTTLRIDTQHNSIEYHYAECRDFFVLSVRLSVIRRNVVLLSVVAPIS